VTTAIPDDTLVQRREGVPIWVIILAVIAGVILLSLLIVCLWKVAILSSYFHHSVVCWSHGTVGRTSVSTGNLSQSYARPTAYG